MAPARRAAKSDSESGFSLIELIIVTAVLPLVVGALTLSLMAVFSLQGGTSNRIGDSSDAQQVSANFEKDVQSSSLLTTATPSSGPAACETSAQLAASDRQLLGLQGGSGQFEISYIEVPSFSGTTATNEMVRNGCVNGSTTPTTTTVIAHDIPTNQAATVVCVSSCSSAVSSGWIPSSEVTSVTFNITAPQSNYPYTLVALPGASSPTSPAATVTTPNSGCGFATAGTGTYATTLCFVDFTAYTGASTCPGSTGYQLMSAPIANTPYTMTFCVSLSGAAAGPHSIPTYASPPTSEAFLGNNGFYTGIPGKPALYQSQGGTTTVSIIDIQVLDSSGSPATGWEAVTGDAESTDAGESMTWSTGSGGPVLSLLPNTPTSPYGNACATAAGGVNLTGVGTTSVTCAASVSSDKTGTVMLESLTPTSITVTMVGTGLEAMFLGVLLP